jgi:hypothetical protein
MGTVIHELIHFITDLYYDRRKIRLNLYHNHIHTEENSARSSYNSSGRVRDVLPFLLHSELLLAASGRTVVKTSLGAAPSCRFHFARSRSELLQVAFNFSFKGTFVRKFRSQLGFVYTLKYQNSTISLVFANCFFFLYNVIRST